MLKKISSLLFIFLFAMSTTACSPAKPNPTATIETSVGNIQVEVFANEIPELSKNFIELSKQGKYDDVPFHRVIKDFMIQTGDFTNKNGTGGHSYKGPGTELAGEFDEKVSSNLTGTLSMANRGPGTNGSQFFINLKDNTFLDHDKQPLESQHPVFAKVISGMDVVESIGNAETVGETLKEEVLIKTITIQDAE